MALVTPVDHVFRLHRANAGAISSLRPAAAACCIGDSIGMALLGLLLTIVSTIMQTNCLLTYHLADRAAFGENLSQAFPHIFSPDSGDNMLQYLQAMHPDMGWAVLVIGLVFLYLSLTPSPRRTQCG